MDTSFERTESKEEWLTPPDLVKSLGDFDLDPCAATNQPWKTAKEHYIESDDGLLKPWHGRVWCNPPYGQKTAAFMSKLKAHGNGIALIFARTETRNWFDNIWSGADAVLFLKGRLRFYNIKGQQADSAGAPSALIAYGKDNVLALKNIQSKGKLILLR